MNTPHFECSIKSKIKMDAAIIYARVSSTTDRQSTERQIRSLTEYAKNNGYEVIKVFSEHISGATKNAERQALNECIDYAVINKTDILISELSRMGRAIWEVLETIKRCIDNGVNVVFQKDGLRLFDENQKVNGVMAIYVAALGFAAEKERENLYFRLHQGRELAKSKGVRMGRKVGSVESRERKAEKHADIIRCLRRGCSIRDTAKICNVGASTVLRVKKEFGIEVVRRHNNKEPLQT